MQLIYNAVIKQITKLNAVREEQQLSNAAQDVVDDTDAADGGGGGGGHGGSSEFALAKNTRVDTMLVDVFYMLSLFFLTIGRGRECPAMFSQIGCMKQLLDHMDESAVYTEADLMPFVSRIQELREMIKNDERQNKHPPQLTKLMSHKLEACQRVVNLSLIHI